MHIQVQDEHTLQRPLCQQPMRRIRQIIQDAKTAARICEGMVCAACRADS
jgi:hypothetical protein